MYHKLLMASAGHNQILVYRGHVDDHPDTVQVMERMPLALLRLRPSPLGFNCEVETIPFVGCTHDEAGSITNVVDIYATGDMPDAAIWQFEVDC